MKLHQSQATKYRLTDLWNDLFGPHVFSARNLAGLTRNDGGLAMSATGLDVFDKTLQTTNIWLDEIAATVGPDRQVAWKVLSVVLHKIRDRLPVELSAHLSAELPLLVRGVYYDQFEPTK